MTNLVQQQLAHCRASIHLIGKNYGAVPEGCAESLPEIQNRLAAERAVKGDFSRLVWIPRGLQVEDERQREFIGHDSVYAGYGRQLTHVGWYRDLLRVEYRHTF